MLYGTWYGGLNEEDGELMGGMYEYDMRMLITISKKRSRRDERH